MNLLSSSNEYDGVLKLRVQSGNISFRVCFERHEGEWSLMKDLSTALTYICMMFINKSLIAIGGSNEILIST